MTPSRRFYLDTSAYLCVLLNERGARKLTKEIAQEQLLSSVLLILETNRNLVRLSRMGDLAAEDLSLYLERARQDQELFLLRDLTLDLCEGWDMPVLSTPKSLDLIHLRTAVWFHDQQPLTRFISLDAGQIQAARELGLPLG